MYTDPCSNQNPPSKSSPGLQREQLKANISHPYITGQKLKPDQECPANSPTPSTGMISSFYKDRTLLVTGGTGFVGQALIAKILRAIPEVRKIYILIRPGKTANGQVTTASGRLTNEFSTSTVFDAFKRADPEGFAAAIQKVEAVEGGTFLTKAVLPVDQTAAPTGHALQQAEVRRRAQVRAQRGGDA